MGKPLIYVSCWSGIENGVLTYAGSSQKMKALLEAQGAEVVILKPDNSQDLSKADAFVLLGNDFDIDPKRYGAEQNPKTQNEMQQNGRSDADFAIAVLRANKEYEIIDLARKTDKPMFGVCGGHQRINVAFGGTLIQHVESQIQKEEMFIPVEPVFIQPDTNLAKAALPHKSTMIPPTSEAGVLVNSYHHQAVDKIGEGLKVAAISSHGTIEALESPNGKITSVQWHPESLPDNNLTKVLITNFVNEAKEYAKERKVDEPAKESQKSESTPLDIDKVVPILPNTGYGR